MNEELFNKPWPQKEDTISPEETVESFARKMQIEQKKELEKKYKPTPEEQEIIKALIAPIRNEIRELEGQKSKTTSKREELKLEGKVIVLLRKLKQIKMPQQMSKDDIKDLLSKVAVHRDVLEKDSPRDNLQKIELIDQEIDFLLDQLFKRLK